MKAKQSPAFQKLRGQIVKIVTGFFFLSFALPASLGQFSGPVLEGASTLGKSTVQLSGHYGITGCKSRFNNEFSLRQAGFGAGIGLTDYVDLKVSYSQWAVSGCSGKSHIFSLITKVGFNHQRVSFFLPLFIYQDMQEYEPGYHNVEPVFIISPRLITSVVRSKNFDLTVSPYMEVIKEKQFIPVYTTGVSVGMGVTSMNGLLSLRTELGIDVLSLFVQNPVFSVGAGLNVNIGKKVGKSKNKKENH